MTNYTILILAALIWFMAKFIRYAFPPLFAPLQASYEITNTQIGMMYTGLLTVYSLLQFPSGLIADRIGAIRVIVIGAFFAGVGSFLVSFNSSIAILATGMLIIGAGTGAHKTVAIGLLSQVYKDRTGRIFGIFDTIGSYGGVGAPSVATLFLVAPDPVNIILTKTLGESWRGIFFLSGFLVIGLSVLFFSVANSQRVIKNKNSSQNDSPSLTNYLNQFTNIRFTIFVVITILFSFSYNGVISFLPLYLTEQIGFGNNTANLLYSLVFIFSFVQIFTGDLSDRVGELTIIFGTLSAAGISVLLLVISSQNSVILFGGVLVIYSLGSNGFRPVRSLYLMELLPKSLASGGLGSVRTLLMGAGAIAPVIVGYISEIADFQVAFIILSIALIISAFLAGILLSTKNV